MERFAIEKFRDVRRIDVLDIFSLEYYSIRETIKGYFITRNRKFVSMIDSDFYYEGNAFFEKPKGLIRIFLKFRIMIDADLFRKTNSSYSRLFIKKSDGVVDPNL
jgi:hypothetical protein